jgi:hypothetical protein
VLALIAGLLAWLWPIGVGGMMPVGGDVTQFFLGLMGVLSEALRAGRLAIWNDLWGYGFPGLAESQMGVYYPVHLIVYRWLNTETAYVVSLVCHTLWGGLGAFWAARRLGISCTGATVAAFSWSACGFFLIHLAHPWSYTTGCWMPWAWGLTWIVLADDGASRPAAPFLLSLVLALQVLPGHFQLAFMTQVVIILMVLWAVVEHRGAFGIGRLRTSTARPALGARRAGAVLLCLAAVIPLAALQLWPTLQLAQLAAGQRDFEYLSGFASTPFHLVNYVAPGLFHRSPLWRPLVWDPFHAMPEEHLAYVGLVPLFLACTTMVREWRRDASVRLMTVLAAATLFFSLGPYAPGFRYLIMLPGFSFFRAPARWSIATALALALLAGKGFDRWSEWRRPGRALGRCALAAVIWLLATVGVLELAVRSAPRPGWAQVSRGFHAAFQALPWTGDPSFEAVLTMAWRPPRDRILPPGLPHSATSFANERGRIYGIELWESAVLLLGLMLLAWRSERGQYGAGMVRGMLVLLTMLDLLLLSRHRLIGVGPLRPLAEQSPTLARLAGEPRGTRVASSRLRNLPMLVGMAPLSAYRTLDVPAVPGLTALAHGPLGDPAFEADVTAALRATGTGLRVVEPLENRVEQLRRHSVASRETIEDPALASWQLDPSWLADQGSWARLFTIWRAPGRPARAWLIPETDILEPGVLDEWSGDPKEILAIFRGAQPLAAESSRPEELTIELTGEAASWVIISQLADPQWRARWESPDRSVSGEQEILPTFAKGGEPGGWQRVKVPGPGRWTLRLEYDASDAAFGLAVSTFAWLSWITAAVVTGWKAARGRLIHRAEQTEA